MKIYNYSNLWVKNLDLKKTVEVRNYFPEEIKQTELMSRKHINVCRILNNIENFLVLTSTITWLLLLLLLLLLYQFISAIKSL